MKKFGEFAQSLKWNITDFTKFCWDCYGPEAKIVDFANDEDNLLNSWYISIVFDANTQEIYEITGESTLFNIDGNRPWRWINPKYNIAYENECKVRKITPNTSWDSISNAIIKTPEDVDNLFSKIINIL